MPTPNLGLPYIVQGQAQKEVTHNEALNLLDAVVQLAVLDRDLAAPPGSPAQGARYIVAASPTGAWAGHADHIAVWLDGAWRFFLPSIGWIAWVADEGVMLAWSGSAWVDALAAISAFQNLALLGVRTTADANNRLSVKSNAVLMSHDDVTPGTGDMRITINKSTAAKDAGFTFQDNFSTRALFGLLASDNFTIKVSPDGSSFIPALVIDKASGLMTHADGVVPRTLYAANGGGTNNSSSGSGSYQSHSLGFSLPASFLNASRVLRVTSAWSYTTGATSAGLRIKLVTGGVDAMEQVPGTPSANLSNRAFTFIHYVQGTQAPAAAAAVETGGYSNANSVSAAATGGITQPVTLNTASPLWIEAKSQWDAAGSGNNAVTLRQLIIEALN